MRPEQVRLADELEDVFLHLGLLPATARDVAESVVTDRSAAGQLRMLAGDAVLLNYPQNDGMGVVDG